MFGLINVLTLLICIDVLLVITLCVKAISYISYKHHEKKYERKVAKCNIVVYARRNDVKATYELAEDRDGDLWPYGTHTHTHCFLQLDTWLREIHCEVTVHIICCF